MKRKKWLKITLFMIILGISYQWHIPTLANESQNLSISLINPIYENEISQKELKAIDETKNSTTETYDSSLTALGNRIREQLVSHKESIVVGYKTQETPSQELIKQVMDEALKYTGNPKEGDYILFQIGGYNGTISQVISEGDWYNLTITFAITYYTTAQHEEAVDNFVDDWKKTFESSSSSNYEKIRTTYDYICKNVKYDYNNMNDESYLLKHTAYAAAINNTAVCQGYSLLLYRLLLEQGIDCRIINGTANEELHTWNSVLLEGNYYYLDATWDAGKVTYDYFLKGKNNFDNHKTTLNYNDISAEDYIYEISSVEDLQIIREHPSGHFILTNNLIMTNSDNSESPFCDITFSGILDGNGYTISNLVRPLFNTISTQGVVKNLSLEALSNQLISVQKQYAPLAIINNGNIDKCHSNIYFHTSKKIVSLRELGGICTQNNGIISNCTANMNISFFSEQSLSFGGICSFNYTDIINCSSTGNVIIQSDDIMNEYHLGSYGGITGINDGIHSNVNSCSNRMNLNGTFIQAGGIIGWNYYGQIKKCNNYGNISSIINDDELYNQVIGGIIGLNENANIIKCNNYGNLYVELTKKGARIVAAGGIVGQIETNYSLKGLVVDKCINQGTVSSVEKNQTFSYNNYSGCIVGTITGEIFSTSGDDFDTIVNDYQPVNIFFKNCFNYGNLSSNNGNKGTPGGIAGDYNIIKYKESRIVFENCFNYGKLTGTSPSDIMEEPIYGSLEYNEFIKLFCINSYFDGNKIYDTAQKDLKINPIIFEENEITMHVGDETTLNFCSTGENKIQWITSDSIVSLADNRITAKNIGHTAVVAFDQKGNFDYVLINVVDDTVPQETKKHIFSSNTFINNACEKIIEYNCSNCGKKYLKHDFKNKHIWDSGYIIKAPSSTAEGLIRYCCKKCGITRQERIEKLSSSGFNNITTLISKITLSGISHKIAAGQRIRLTPSITPANASNQKLIWSSSNKKIATVSQNGLVKIKKKTGGKSVIITAKSSDHSGIKASFRIKSMKGIVKKIIISGTKQKKLKAGKKLKLKTKVIATKGANKKLLWLSSNTKYATVSKSGTVKAKKAGKGKTVKITAISTDGSNKRKTIKVKIL